MKQKNGLSMLAAVLLFAAAAIEILAGGNRAMAMIFLCLGFMNLCVAVRNRKVGEQKKPDHL